MRVTIEVGNGQELCYLLDREIDTKRTSRDILAAMPPERTMTAGGHSYAESVKWCDEDIAAYSAIRESLARALHNRRSDGQGDNQSPVGICGEDQRGEGN